MLHHHSKIILQSRREDNQLLLSVLLILFSSFYKGEHDAVTCFFCAGTISHWLPGDDPWSVHANFFPECMFVYIKRGKHFIDGQRRGIAFISDYTTPNPVSGDKTRYECKICFSAEVGVVFRPCEHVIACYDCATNFKYCPWCKEKIEDIIRFVIPT